MTTSRLYFGPGPNTVDIIVLNHGLDIVLEQKKKRNVSTNGTIEVINQYSSQTIKIDAIFTRAVHRDLQAWWSWARQGKVFAFAVDVTKVCTTNLAVAAAAGQKNIVVNSSSGLSVGDYCILWAEDNDDEFEIIEVDSISGGVITAVDNLIYSYSVNDTFRHWRYWSKLVSMDMEFSPKIMAGTAYYRFMFEFAEGDAIVPMHAIFEDTDDVIWQDTGDVVWM